MALSGTLETFSLPDVLRLLSSTGKTGLLALDGDRGAGRIWVDGGDIVAAEADRAGHGGTDAALFELLRFRDATFEFDPSAEAPERAGDRHPVEGALEEAERRLVEWKEIEAVVPSLDVVVRMVPDIDADVTVPVADWHVLARVGSGASGHDVARHLDEGEYEVCRRLRDLAVAGLIEVEDVVAVPQAAVVDAFEALVHAPAPDTPVFEVGVEAGPVATDALVATLDAAGPDPVLVPIEGGSADHPDADHPDAEQTEPPPSSWATAEAELRVEADEAGLLADLAHLSPRAAAAVEATWGAEAEAAPPGAPADAADEEATDRAGELDQNLLLRFLSSSKP